MRFAPIVAKRTSHLMNVEVRTSRREAARKLTESLKRNGVRGVEPSRLEGSERWVFYVPLGRQMPIYRLRAIVKRIDGAIFA